MMRKGVEVDGRQRLDSRQSDILYGFLMPPSEKFASFKVIFRDTLEFKERDINAISYYDDNYGEFKTFESSTTTTTWTPSLSLKDTKSDISTYPIIIDVNSIPEDKREIIKKQQQIYSQENKKIMIVNKVNHLYKFFHLVIVLFLLFFLEHHSHHCHC